MANDVISLIELDHARMRDAMSRLAESEDEDERCALWAQIAGDLPAHEEAEQQTVYIALAKEDESLVESRLHEEDEAHALLDAMKDLPPVGEPFERKFKELAAAVLKHADEEEESVLPKLRERPREELLELGRAFHDHKERHRNEIARTP
jgi:hemerythrin superfamily protein